MFMQWRAGEFRLEEDEGPMAEARARYRQHIIDRFSKLTLYSVTSDKPLAVDLERVFVKLSATERQSAGVLAGAHFREPAEQPGSEMRDALSAFRRAKREERAADPGEQWERTESSAHEFRIGSGTPVRAVERHLSLNEALAEHSELAIVGAPGSGKTTLLKYIALSFARRQARYRLGLDEDRLPVFIVLRDFSKYLEGLPRVGGILGADLVKAYLVSSYSQYFPSLALPEGFFDTVLAEGRCIVLMDGLDEVADSSLRSHLALFLWSFAATSPGNRFVVTSRPRGYEVGRQYLAGAFDECTIQDFDQEQIAGFVTSWYLAVTVDREGDTPTARDGAAKSAEDLLTAVKSAQIRSLAANPLLMSILALIHQRGNRLPQRRVALYEECIEFLLGFWRQVQGGEAARELAGIGGLTTAEKRVIIEPIALWLHERGESGAEVSREELEQQLGLQFEDLFGQPKKDALRRAASFVDILVDHAGLLVERETGVFAFAHLTFQEFLAARALADRGDYIEFVRPHLHDPWWREVILLLAGYLSTPCTRRSRAETAALLNAIHDAGSPLEKVLHRDLLLAFRCLCDVEQLGVDQPLRTELTDRVITLWRETSSPALRHEIEGLFAYAAPTPVGERAVSRLVEFSWDAALSSRKPNRNRLGSAGTAADDVRVRAAEALGSLGAAPPPK
jgi:hypothetical protein